MFLWLKGSTTFEYTHQEQPSLPLWEMILHAWSAAPSWKKMWSSEFWEVRVSRYIYESFLFFFLCEYTCVLFGTDKQLVELIHAKALEALKGNQQSPLRYQSVTVFLRGELSAVFGKLSTPWSLVQLNSLINYWCNILNEPLYYLNWNLYLNVTKRKLMFLKGSKGHKNK